MLSVLQLYNQIQIIIFVEKMREGLALQKLLTFFSTKNNGVFQI